MKQKTNSDLEKQIKNAVSQMTPNQSEKVWEQPVEKASGNEWYLDGIGIAKKQTGKVIHILSALAACCVISFLSFYVMVMRADATIYLDVNPSVELKIDRNEKVISAEANNADGEQILEEMDLKHTDLDVAMNALIGSMVKHGYLSEARHVVLVSVESSDSRKAEQLKSHVSEEIYTYLENLIGSGKVFEQQIQMDTELKKITKTYRITPGKAAIMKKIVQLYPELDYAKLASLSLEELVEYLETDEEDDLEEWKEEQKSYLSEEDLDDDDKTEKEDTEEIEETYPEGQENIDGDLEDDFSEESEDQEAEETEQEGIETESD